MTKKTFFFIILCLFCCAGVPVRTYAQTDRELLLELVKQQVETNKQITELAKQQAITAAKVDGMDKRLEGMDKRLDGMDKRLDGMDKRLDFMQNLMLIIIPLIIASIGTLIGFILWDRKTTMKPIEDEMKKEITKLQEREQKLEDAIKKIIQIEPRFSGVI